MADPRQVSPDQRKNPLSPLMTAKSRASLGEVINRCPYGCEAFDMDEHGNCAHLIGFTSGGLTFEPRIKLPNGLIITCGAKRQPLQKGMRFDKITVSARVYSKSPNPDLVPPRSENDIEAEELIEQEREILSQMRRVTEPQLEGEWLGTIYDKPLFAAMARAKEVASKEASKVASDVTEDGFKKSGPPASGTKVVNVPLT